MLNSSRLIDLIDLPVADLPLKLDGFRIAQVSDVHDTGKGQSGRRTLAALGGLRFDLLALTGDYMTIAHDESAAVRTLETLGTRVKPRFGIVGVFGNHDSPALRARVADLPIRWLRNEALAIQPPGLCVVGVDMDEQHNTDALAATMSIEEDARGLFRIMLAHVPTVVASAADLGARVVLSGHTHGGQCRLPRRVALVNSTGLPLNLSAGLLRHRDTLCAVSRGLGEVRLPLRTCCDRQLPIYTLRRAPTPGVRTDRVVNLRPW